jgi:hypothetical protein
MEIKNAVITMSQSPQASVDKYRPLPVDPAKGHDVVPIEESLNMEEVSSFAVRASQVNDRLDRFYQACGGGRLLPTIPHEVFSGTLSDFLAVVEYGCEQFGDRFCARVEYFDNKAMIYEIPSSVHEEVAMEFYTQASHALGNRHNDFGGTGGARYNTTNSSREGDGGFVPRNKISQVPGQRPWPNIVIEVNYSCELHDLVNKINNFWLSDETTVQQVVLIDIGYPDAIAGVRSLIVYNFLRNGATTIDLVPRFDISYPPMLNAGDVAFQFPVRLQDIYFGDGINLPDIETLDLPDSLLVDLYWIQRACAECLPVTL